jgi:hypothetical protein
MTNTPAIRAAMPAADIRARNRDILFAALAAAGIHRVTVDYDGSGDSGQIDTIEASNSANENIPFPSDTRIQFASENAHAPPAEYNLEAAVESAAWDCLDDLYYGWENNDGAFGRFVFDVPARTVTLEHNERFTDFNTSSHQF